MIRIIIMINYLSLPLAVVGVGVARVGIGVASVGGHDVGGSDGSDGGVGDHADVVGPSILDCLGNVGSCGNLANSPGLGLGLGLEEISTGIQGRDPYVLHRVTRR